jgi:hypothetical protein
VAGTAALFLTTSAYQASWGQGCDPFYEDCGGGGGGGDDDGLSGGEIAGITIGGLAAGYGIWLLAAKDKDDDDEEEQQKVMAPSLKSGAAASAVRLVPQKTAVGAGDRTAFDLQARSSVDGKWYSVTGSDAATVALKDSKSGLVRQDGAKNVFCLPISAQSAKSAVVTGRLNRPGAAPLVAQTTVQLGS